MLTEDQIAYVARAALEELELQKDGVESEPFPSDVMDDLIAEVSIIISGDAKEPVTYEEKLLHAVVGALKG